MYYYLCLLYRSGTTVGRATGVLTISFGSHKLDGKEQMRTERLQRRQRQLTICSDTIKPFRQ